MESSVDLLGLSGDSVRNGGEDGYFDKKTIRNKLLTTCWGV